MKRYLLPVAIGLVSIGCVKSAVDPLSDDYPEPATYDFNQIVSSERTKDEGGKFHFELVLTTAEGDALSLELVADTYYLPAKTFSGATAEAARSGNYVTSACYFTKSGAAPVPLNNTGTLTVGKNDTHYTAQGYLWTAEGEAFHVNASFDTVYEPEDEPVKMPALLVANPGAGSVTVVLATDGVSASPNLYGGTDYKGTGNYIALDIYSPDGKLYPGTYEPSLAGGYITEGRFGIGWEMDYEYMPGMSIKVELGSRWYTIENDASTNVALTTGAVTVEKTGSTYTVSYRNDDIWVSYTGAIEALDYETIDYVSLTKAVQVAQTGANTLTLRLASDGVEASWVEAYQYFTFSGEGNYVTLEIYTADGTLAAGSYKASAGQGCAEGEFGSGYSWDYEYAPGMFYTIAGGSTWYTLAGGNETSAFITDGVVNVSYEGDVCTIVLESSAANAKFVGKLAE